MIHFSCSHCGMKFQVQDEFAGRSTRCPTCEQPLLVPADEYTEAYVPPAHLGGALRSLAQAGVEGGVTLDHADTADPDGRHQVRELLAQRPQSGERYAVGGEIARGGMGVVLRAVDCDIRREVAVKFLLSQADAGRKQRFVEEAQITGQLEHPNIVPIHELTIDAQGRLFFSMKMVRGRSLAQVLDALRQDMRTAEKEWPLGRLLNVLVGICNALDYAHSRGVIHRDLKPANIMVGDFGEVYVMDWGLAKVLKDGERSRVSAPSAANAPGADAAPLAAVVTTSRADDADLTQEGTVMGTPVYMPPEQAGGQIHAIDQRSDVYSLGAILYEMLAMRPPIDKEGGHAAILRRVVEGEIVPPERENRRRARLGRIPRDLSAVAMKALAKRPEDRYANVEALRRDVERFQEGRSVSARADSKRQMLVRFVKRNRTTSWSAAVVLLVLAVSVGLLVQAGIETYRTNAAYRSELEEKLTRTKRAVPAFVRAARHAANEGQLDEAQAQLDFAREYDPENLDARLLKGQILLARMDWSAACNELREYVRQRPRDDDARKLVQLSADGRLKDTATLVALAEVFQRQKVFGLAAGLLQDIQRMWETRKPLLPLYQKQIDTAMPGLGKQLSLQADGQFALELSYCKQIASLQPLKGMPIHILSVHGCGQITDLTPLEDMPLTYLDIDGNPVRDLSPLKGMPLTYLDISGNPVRDLSPLKGMPLTTLKASGKSQVTDLTPLAGMRLIELNLHGNPVRDLTPLKGMPLTTLNIYASKVQDLRPLKGMPLTTLHILYTPAQDLTPLAGMRLETISLNPNTITTGIAVLRRMESLKTIAHVWNQPLSPAEFWKKYDDGEFK